MTIGEVRAKRVLAGDYVGANALVGGFDRSFTLQPFSVEAQTAGTAAVKRHIPL
jgi:hypothetical protein